jgi:hypothetical protein
MRTSVSLAGVDSGRQALASLWCECVKPALLAGQRLEVTIEPERRSLDANAKFHKLCEVAARHLQWGGKRRTSSEWKVLLVSGHSVATKQGADIVPGLEGEFVNIRESTARMSRARSASLIDYTTAFLVTHGVEVNEPETV